MARYRKEQEVSHKSEVKEIITGDDETFFHSILILVLMELGSGYLEEFHHDKNFETWQKAASKHLDELSYDVRLFTNDKDKALMKLALEEFSCEAKANITGQDISHWLRVGFPRQLEKAEKTVKDAQTKLSVLTDKPANNSASLSTAKKARQQAEQRLKQAEGAQYKHKQGKKKYQKAMHGISKALHPFSLENKSQSSTEITRDLKTQIETLTKISEKHNIPKRHKILDKFNHQIQDLAGRVNAWWLWVDKSLKSLHLNAEYNSWAKNSLLPVIY